MIINLINVYKKLKIFNILSLIVLIITTTELSPNKVIFDDMKRQVSLLLNKSIFMTS